jgi:hypothetical protein
MEGNEGSSSQESEFVALSPEMLVSAAKGDAHSSSSPACEPAAAAAAPLTPTTTPTAVVQMNQTTVQELEMIKQRLVVEHQLQMNQLDRAKLLATSDAVEVGKALTHSLTSCLWNPHPMYVYVYSMYVHLLTHQHHVCSCICYRC